MISQILRIEPFGIRAIIPADSPSSHDDFQKWHEDHQKYRWNQTKRLTKKLVDGTVSPEEWADLFDGVLLEGHSNAWYIGRVLGGSAGEFNDDDLNVGRGFKDVEADYLAGFLDDIQNGRYTLEDGTLSDRQILARARLYVGKMRGTINEAWVYASPDESEWFWRLGGNELHCADCPHLAEILIGVLKSELFTKPGAGDTPCLGHCLCFLESLVADKKTVGVKASPMELPDEDAAAA